jgi:hypothetical protein
MVMDVMKRVVVKLLMGMMVSHCMVIKWHKSLLHVVTWPVLIQLHTSGMC